MISFLLIVSNLNIRWHNVFFLDNWNMWHFWILRMFSILYLSQEWSFISTLLIFLHSLRSFSHSSRLCFVFFVKCSTISADFIRLSIESYSSLWRNWTNRLIVSVVTSNQKNLLYRSSDKSLEWLAWFSSRKNLASYCTRNSLVLFVICFSYFWQHYILWFSSNWISVLSNSSLVENISLFLHFFFALMWSLVIIKDTCLFQHLLLSRTVS